MIIWLFLSKIGYYHYIITGNSIEITNQKSQTWKKNLWNWVIHCNVAAVSSRLILWIPSKINQIWEDIRIKLLRIRTGVSSSETRTESKQNVWRIWIFKTNLNWSQYYLHRKWFIYLFYQINWTSNLIIVSKWNILRVSSRNDGTRGAVGKCPTDFSQIWKFGIPDRWNLFCSNPCVSAGPSDFWAFCHICQA